MLEVRHAVPNERNATPRFMRVLCPIASFADPSWLYRRARGWMAQNR